MEAQTFTWLVFLALIHVSTSDPRNPFKVEPGGLTATEGFCVEIKCQVTRDVDDPDANWLWMKDRQWVKEDRAFTSTVIYSTNTLTHPVSPDFADRVKYIGSSSSSWRNGYSAEPKPLCSILICDLRTSDSGKYSFRFVGRETWTSEEVTLNVEVNRCPLTFEKPAVVVESDVVTLTCSTSRSCPSDPHIQAVTQIDRTQITGTHPDKERTTTFRFTASSEDDGKVFSCQTQDNKDKYLIRNITVTVKYSPKHVTVQAHPGLDVKENVMLTLSCSAKSNPPVRSVTWRKTTDGREEIIQQPQTQTFTVNSVSRSDSGLYSCEATNDIGSVKSEPAEVKVRYPPTEPILSMSSEVTEGHTITVNCTAESFPQSTLTLARTFPYPQVVIITEKNLYSRPINSLSHKFTVTSADAGWYVCRALNSEGSRDSKQKELVVKYSPKHVTVQANPGLDVKENVMLTLSCSAESNPPVRSVTWRKTTDGREEIIQQTQTWTRTFTVNSVSRSDSGLYSCEATNDIGSVKSQPAEVKVRYPPTEPKLSMSSEVTEGQTITVTCSVDSFPQSTLTLMRTITNHQSSIITENNLYSRPINSLSHKFTVTSADAGWYVCSAKNSEGSRDSEQKKLVVKYSPKHVTVQARPGLEVKENVMLTLSCSAESNPPVRSVTWRKTTDGREEIIQQTRTFRVNSVSPSDSGLYSCEATNDIGSVKSQRAEVKVRFSPKLTIITESSEKQEPDGRSSVMLSCTSHSFPPVHSYSWYRKSQSKEKDELVSEHPNHTVYSDQSGVYYCIAENEIDQSLSDPVHLFERNYLDILKFLLPALFVLMIIILIIVVLRFKKKKSIQQGTTNRPFLFGFLGWCNGSRRRSRTYENVSAEPFRSRDDLLSEQLRRPGDQRRQPPPDSTPPSDINVVYSVLNLPQAASAQNPTRQQAGNTEDDYTSLPFKNKNKQRKVEEDSVYAIVSKPTRVKKNEPENMHDYENISIATARPPTSPNLYDDHTSEGEVELDYSQVSFTATPQRHMTNRDSSSSDDEETSYSDIRI